LFQPTREYTEYKQQGTGTGLGHFADCHALFFGHETKHGEDGKTGVETCAAVDDRQHYAVSVFVKSAEQWLSNTI